MSQDPYGDGLPLFWDPSLPPDSPALRPLPGVEIRKTPRGICVFTLDFWADRERQDPAWIEGMRRLMSPKDLKREFLRDWTTAAGDAFYPEWGELPLERKMVRAAGIHEGPVYRGWDFGYRHPSCLWMQYDQSKRRLWVMRELCPADIGTHAFRDLVLYLSGELEREKLAKWPSALHWLYNLEHDRRYPPTPWFQHSRGTPIRFIDYAGHEALKRSATVENETAARTDAMVLADGGINLHSFYATPKAREDVLRPLLRLRSDGYSGLLIDPACPVILEGMAGGICYPKPTPQNPNPTDPQKDEVFEHPHDALGYVAVNVVPLGEFVEGGRLVTYRGRKAEEAPAPASDQGIVDGIRDLGFYETRR